MAYRLDRCVFIAVPKTGSSVVLEALRLNNQRNPHGRLIPHDVRHLRRIAIVRDPYARALSLYHFERELVDAGRQQSGFGSPQEFAEHWQLHDLTAFLERLISNRARVELPAFLPCSHFLAMCEPVDVIHRERLQEEWLLHPDLPEITLPSDVDDLEYDGAIDELDETQRELVEAWAAEDFERYGYPCGSVAAGDRM